jgi:hypothetical protein
MKQQLGRDAFISVFKDPVYGWNAKVFAPPSKASGMQAILDEIVRVLRSHYDLNRGRFDCNYYDSGKSDILDRFPHES